MHILQIYSSVGRILGADENQQFLPMPGKWNIYPMAANRTPTSNAPLDIPEDVRYVVHYEDAKGDQQTAWVREYDHAFILNSEGKTFRTINRPVGLTAAE